MKFLRIFLLMIIGLLSNVILTDGTFVSADVNAIRIIADKLTKPSADARATFLKKARELVAAFKDATPEERISVIGSIEDAQYGRLMDEIVNDLKILSTTALGTPAGAPSKKLGTSAAGTTAPVASAAETYLDRINSLSAIIETCRKIQTTISDETKTTVNNLLLGLYSDRGDAFPEEISKIATTEDTPEVQPLLNRASIFVFREDSRYIDSTKELYANFLKPIDFITKLIVQRKLRNIYGSLTAPQVDRILRHFRIMVDMLSTVTDASLIEEFKELLKTVNVKFFDEHPTKRSILMGIINQVAQFDPIFSKTYAEIIIKLRNDSLVLPPNEIKPFVEKLKILVNNGYGTKPEDISAKSTNLKSIQDFLTMVLDLPPFADYVVDIAKLLSKVKFDAGSVEIASSFGDNINAVSTSDRIIATQNATGRSNFMATLKSLMDSRYGQSDKDKTSPEINLNKRKLLQLLGWVASLPWFIASQPDLDVIKNYIMIVNKDPENGPFASVSSVAPSGVAVVPTAPVGTFNVGFSEDLDSQITKLEQSFPAVSSDNHKELFILSLYDAVKRKSGATTVNINKMKALINIIRSNSVFGTNYHGFCTFLLGSLDNSTDASSKNQVLLDFMSRVSAMTLIVDRVQEEFIRFAEDLFQSYPTNFNLSQMSTLLVIIKNVTSKTYFKAEHLEKAVDLELEVSQKIVDAGGDVSAATTTTQTTTQTTTPTTPTTQTTTPTTPTTPTTATTPIPVVLTPAQIKAAQDKAARDFHKARSNNWRN